MQHIALHSFLSVYRTGSQTKAAAELCLTQPAISQHIKTLEKHINRPLFKRVGKYIEPTAIAHQLAFMIRSHIDALDTVWEHFEPIQQSTKGPVYLGGIAEFFSTVIAPCLAPLSKQGIQIRF